MSDNRPLMREALETLVMGEWLWHIISWFVPLYCRNGFLMSDNRRLMREALETLVMGEWLWHFISWFVSLVGMVSWWVTIARWWGKLWRPWSWESDCGISSVDSSSQGKGWIVLHCYNPCLIRKEFPGLTYIISSPLRPTNQRGRLHCDVLFWHHEWLKYLCYLPSWTQRSPWPNG